LGSVKSPEDYLIYPGISEHLSIDELSLSKESFIPLLPIKWKRKRKKTLVAVIKGTKSRYY
jgi:hypothetical protein